MKIERPIAVASHIDPDEKRHHTPQQTPKKNDEDTSSHHEADDEAFVTHLHMEVEKDEFKRDVIEPVEASSSALNGVESGKEITTTKSRVHFVA